MSKKAKFSLAIILIMLAALFNNLNPLFSLPQAMAAGPDSTQVQVDLSPYFNNDAFSNATYTYANIDSYGNSFPAAAVNTTPTINGISYHYGSMADNTNNNIKAFGQTISLPPGQYTKLGIVGVATNSRYLNMQTGKITFHYTDGTTSEANLILNNMFYENSNSSGSAIVQTMNHYHNATTGDVTFSNVSIYRAYVAPVQGKTVDSVILPNNSNINIFAMTLIPGVNADLYGDFNQDAYSSPSQSQVDISSYFNSDSFSGPTDKTDGDFDGFGDSFPTEVVNPIPYVNGILYQYGLNPNSIDPFHTGNNNTVKATGQTLSVPAGKYNEVGVVGTASNSGSTTSQTGTVTFHYSDSTTSTGTLTLHDLLYENVNNANFVLVQTIGHYHSPIAGGKDISTNVSIYRAIISPDPSKTLTTITLPNNSNIKIFAMTVIAYPLDGAYDTDSSTTSAYAGELISNFSLNDGTSYNLAAGPDGEKNAIASKGQSVLLRPGKYSSIRMAASATGGDQTGTFTIVYTDGTTSTQSVTMKDWVTTNPSGQMILQTIPKLHFGAALQSTANYIFLYYLNPLSTKTVASIILPNNRNMHVLGITMMPFAPVQVDLSTSFNKDGFSYDTARSDGNFDGGGNTYSADLITTNPSYEGVFYTLGSMANGAKNVVYAAGQTIALPQGNYASIRMLGSGHGDQTGTFRINYTDLTYSDVSITEKDWWTANIAALKVVQNMPHNHNPSGDVNAAVKIFPYYLTPVAGKTVSSIRFPTNLDMNVFAITLVPTGQVQAALPNPQVVTTSLGSADVPIASYNVVDFGAVSNGTGDNTAAFQNALNAASDIGGAVVFVPAGKYKFLGHITVPDNVTMRGEWVNPDSGSIGSGTVLEPYQGKDDAAAAPFISTNSSSTVRDLAIWYPEQDIANVHAYPWTISSETWTSYGPNLSDITLVNSYNGIRLYKAGSALLQNIYGTVLNQGAFTNAVAEIIRFNTVHFRPKYWANSALGTPPTESTIKSYTYNNATGFTYYRADGAWLYDIYLEGYNTGLLYDQDPLTKERTSGQIYNLHTEGGKYGIKFNYVENTYVGTVSISGSTINTTGSGAISVSVPSTVGPRTGGQPVNLMFTNSTIGSPNGIPVQVLGKSEISFNHVAFTDWDSSHFAIEASAGTLVALANSFSVHKSNILLNSGVSSASIANNDFTGTPIITNNSTGSISIDTAYGASGFAHMPTSGPELSTYRKSSSNNFYNVKSNPYNAVGDGVADDTSHIQSALTVAGNAGGGTVYVPAGRYKINTHLSIPSNVELRGISDGPHYYGSGNRGSVLLASETGTTAFITLAANAGILGLSIFYPSQIYMNTDTLVTYPATILGNGTGNYVINVTMPDSYDAIKMTQGNFYINGVRGLGLHTFINISGVTNANPALDLAGKGYILNAMVTGADAQNGTREDNAPPFHYWTLLPATFPTTTAFLINNSDYVQLFNNFAFNQYNGLDVEGTSHDLMSFGFGIDSGVNGIQLNGSGTYLDFINTETGGPLTNYKYITTGSGFTGSAYFYNTFGTWAAGGSIFNGTGSVLLQQYVGGSGGVTVHHGSIWMDSSFLEDANMTNQLILDAGITGAQIYGNVGNSLGFGVTNNYISSNLWMNIRGYNN